MSSPSNIFGFTSDNESIFPDQALVINDTTNSTSTNTGAFIVQGGAGIQEDLFIGGSIYGVLGTASQPNITSLGTLSSLNITNGLTVGNKIYCNGSKEVATTDMLAGFAQASGIVTYTAGAGVSVDGTVISIVGTQNFTSLTAGSLSVSGSSNLSGIVSVLNTTASTSPTSGALTVAGGLGVSGTIKVGGGISCNSDIFVGSDRLAHANEIQVYTAGTNVSLQSNVISIIPSPTVTSLAVTGTAVSTSSNTGSVTISGGLGVQGAGWFGSLYSNGQAVLTSVTPYTAGNQLTLTSNQFNLVPNLSVSSIAITATTNTTSTSTGAIVCSGGLGVSKSAFFGGGIYVNQNSLSGTPTIQVSPSSTGIESSIGFWVNPSSSGQIWVLGHGTASLPADNFGLYSGSFGANVLSVSNTGVTTIYTTIDSTSTSTGGLIVKGGLSVSKTLNVGGQLYVSGSQVATQGQIQTYTAGSNLALSSNQFSLVAAPTISGVLSVTNTAQSSSIGTGALIVSGGFGLSKDFYHGGVYFNKSSNPQIRITNITSTSEASILFSSSTDYSTTSGTNFYLGLNVGTGVSNFGLNSSSAGVVWSVSSTGVMNLTNTTDTTATANGSLIIAGGAGIGKSLQVGGNITIPSSQTLYGGYLNLSGTTNNNYSSGVFIVGNTTDSVSSASGSFQVYGGASITKSLYAGSTIYTNWNGTSDTPMVRISPSANNGESSIGFYRNTQASSDVFVIGTNVGGIGNAWGIYNSVFGGVPFQVLTTGDILIPNLPKIGNIPQNCFIQCSNFTCNNTGYVAISGLTFSNTNYNNGTNSIKLVGKGLYRLDGIIYGDAVSNFGSLNYVDIICALNGVQFAHTYSLNNFSSGNNTWQYSTTFVSSGSSDILTILSRYHGQAGQVTNVGIAIQIIKLQSYQ